MKRLLAAIAILLCTASPVLAKEGFYLGAYFLPSTDVSGIAGVDPGSGYGFRAGLGFSRYLAIEGTYDRAKQDFSGGKTADLRGVAVDLKVNFPLTSLDSRNVMTFEPYLRVGYGTYELSNPSASPSGSGPRFGVGIEQYLFRELSIDAGWTRTKVSFGSPVNADGTVKTISVGLNYHFL